MRALHVLSIAGVVALLGCGSDGGSDFDGGTTDGGSPSDGGGGGDSPFGDLDGSTTDGGGGGDGSACNAPVDMYIMQDRSGSMGADCNIGDSTPSKWCRAVNALSGYFKSPSAANNGVALQFFPLPNHTQQLCTTGTGYDVAALPTPPPAYTTLPSSSFDALLNSTSPSGNGGGTPTEAAIRGLTKFTAGNRRAGRVTIGILVTDGDPNGCDEVLKNLSDLLQAHNTATKIRTYVIGMTGANFANLEAIAQGGNAPLHPDAVGGLTDACGNGPGPCRHWNVADGNPAAFVAALAAIQESADGCKDGGGVINPPN